MNTIPPNSLIPLCDGRPGLRRGLAAEIREPAASASDSQPSTATPSTSSPILDFIASSEALDRYNEIIVASGWRLENYRRNPVFQNAHQYGDVIFTLGKALITEVRRGSRDIPSPAEEGQGEGGIRGSVSNAPYLFQRIQFATDVNPMARIAYGLYKGKFLNAVSVGFIPLKWEDAPRSPSSSASPSASASTPRRRYLEQELLEVSAVGIPANPEALQLGLRAGAVEKADVKETLQLLKAACAETPNQDDLRRGQRLLELARNFRDVLKAL